MGERLTILCGDSLERLIEIPDGSIHCVVTSPPYWGLRDYKLPKTHWPAMDYAPMLGLPPVAVAAWTGCLGLEPTPEMFVAHIVLVFRQVLRVLRKDGTCWLNFGDCYSNDTKWGGKSGGKNATSEQGGYQGQRVRRNKDCDPKRGIAANGQPLHHASGLKPKDQVGIPWRVAFALQADGWWLRMDNVWCLSGGSSVYARTQKGDMPVMVKDLVRLKPSTVKLWNGTKWTQVLGWGQSTDRDQKLEIVLRSGERIGCTRTHEWPTQRDLVKAGDLLVGDTIQTCLLPDSNKPAPAFMTEDIAWLIGLYLAEGSRSEDTVQLAMHADEFCWLPRIKATVEHLGGSIAYTIDGDGMSVRIYGRIVAAVIDEYLAGNGAHRKHFTNQVWELPNTLLRQIVTGYLAGDGHLDRLNNRYRLGFARNYALERDLRTAAARLGAIITLKPCVSKCKGKSFPSFRGEWRWETSGHYNCRDRGEILEIRNSRARKCWDISVEDEPHLFALSSGVLTHNCKPNPMPESVTDRPTKAHEYVFLLAKSKEYFYDLEAIKERSSPGTHARLSQATLQTQKSRDRTPAEILKAMGRKLAEQGVGIKNNGSMDSALAVMPLTRNKRSVWTITTQPFKGAHFATFPGKLVEPCIMAGTSQHGACGKCGAPWERITHSEKGQPESFNGSRFNTGKTSGAREHIRPVGSGDRTVSTSTLGWQPTCECHGKFIREKVTIPARMSKDDVAQWGADQNGEYNGQSTKCHTAAGVQDASAIKARIIENATKDREVKAWVYHPAIPIDEHPLTPCVVLDPFGGSGTTAQVALELGRHAVIIELNPDYISLANDRIKPALDRFGYRKHGPPVKPRAQRKTHCLKPNQSEFKL